MQSANSSSEVSLPEHCSQSEDELPCLGATQIEKGQITTQSKDKSIPYAPAWMQCGLFPPKRFPIYKRTADNSEMDRRVDSWMFDCEGLIAVYKNWNRIIENTIKESQSARSINRDRFAQLQKKYECVRMASIHSATRVEVQREFMGDSSHLQM